jgi:hypothetical protein
MTVQRIVGDVRRALGYLVEGARLLKRYPALLLLPVVVVLFNAAEGDVGRHLMIQRTEYGRWLREHARELPREPSPNSRFWIVRVEMPGGTAVPTMPLSGTTAVLGAVIVGRPRDTALNSSPGGDSRLLLVALTLSLLLLAPVNALVRGGYYGLVAAVVRTGRAAVACLVTSAARFFARLWLLLALLAAACFAFLLAFPVLASNAVGFALLRGAGWFMVAGLFLVTLVSSALVWEDMSLWAAVRRGVITVERDLAVAVPLCLVAAGAEKASAWLFQWVRGWTWQRPDPAGLTP